MNPEESKISGGYAMLLKISAGVLFVLGGFFCGLNMSDKLKRRVVFCRECEKLLNVCEYMVRSNNSDVYGIIRHLKEERFRCLGFIEKLPECYSPEDDLRQIWKNAVLSDRFFDADERDILNDLGDLLGSTDLDGQLRGMDDIRSCIKSISAERIDCYRKKGRLYRSIGVLSGVSLGIIII